MKKEITNKIEREYTIPLRAQVMKVPRYKRAKKAIRTIREFLVKHMQIRDKDLKKIKLDKYLNQMIWSRGIKSPPHKIRVKAIKEGDIVRVEAYELSKKIGFKKQREEKRDKKSVEQLPKKKAEAKEDKIEKPAELKADEDKKIEEEKKKKKTTIESTQKYEKRKAKERKHEGGVEKKPLQKKKEHSKGSGTGR